MEAHGDIFSGDAVPSRLLGITSQLSPVSPKRSLPAGARAEVAQDPIWGPPCAPRPPQQRPHRRGPHWGMGKCEPCREAGGLWEPSPGAAGGCRGVEQRRALPRPAPTPGPGSLPCPRPTAPLPLSPTRGVRINPQFAFVTGQQREAVPRLPGVPTGTSTPWST